MNWLRVKIDTIRPLGLRQYYANRAQQTGEADAMYERRQRRERRENSTLRYQSLSLGKLGLEGFPLEQMMAAV